MPWKCWMSPDYEEIRSETDVNNCMYLFCDWFPGALIQNSQLIPVSWDESGRPECYQLVIFYIEVR